MPRGTFLDNDAMWYTGDVGQRSATAGIREELLDIITITDPTETPLLSTLDKIAVQTTNPEWLLDRLTSFGDPDVGDADVAVQPEGQDVTFNELRTRQRVSNLTHIIRTQVDVTDTMRAVNTAGLQDEFLYQLYKATIEWARYAEFALMHSRRQSQSALGNISGTPATARKMEGILWFLEPDPSGVSTDHLHANQEGTITEAGSPSAQLTETIYNNHMAAGYEKGVTFRTTYANHVQKREISQFSANVTRNIEAYSKQMVANIDVYEADFGLQAVLLHRYMPVREVLTLDDSYWKVGVLIPPMAVELAKLGDSTKAMVQGEVTLVAQAPATGGKIVWASSVFGANVG